MAAYHIKDETNPEDKGVLVSADTQAQALKQIIDGRFTITTLNTDALAALVQQNVPFHQPKPAKIAAE